MNGGLYKLTHDNDLNGILNCRGEMILDCKYRWIGNFSDGLIWVSPEYGNCFFTHSEVNFVIEGPFSVTSDFNEGRAAVKNDEWGVIDTDGNLIVPYHYDSISDFKDGLAKVRKDGKTGFIDRDGNEVIHCILDNASHFSEGFAPVYR